MALETTVILRAILLSAKSAESVEEVVNAIEALCSKEDIATVNEQFKKNQELKSK